MAGQAPGDRVTVTPSLPATTPRRLHRLSQRPAGRLPQPAGPKLPGLVIPENIVGIRRPPMPAPRACGGHEQDRGGERVDPEQRRGAGDGPDMPVALFREAAAGCLEVG